jgi:hypothetical protein
VKARDFAFGASLLAMAALSLPSARTVATPASAAVTVDGLVVRAAWLAQRETALGDWEAVAPPLRSGDELSLTVRADEDAFVYVLAESEGERRVLFPPPGSPRELARVRAGWQYAVPARHLTWRLDGAAHDRFTLVAARHPLADPFAAAASPPGGRTAIRPASDVELPLRDGRAGTAPARVLAAPEVVVEEFVAR